MTDQANNCPPIPTALPDKFKAYLQEWLDSNCVYPLFPLPFDFDTPDGFRSADIECYQPFVVAWHEGVLVWLEQERSRTAQMIYKIGTYHEMSLKEANLLIEQGFRLAHQFSIQPYGIHTQSRHVFFVVATPVETKRREQTIDALLEQAVESHPLAQLARLMQQTERTGGINPKIKL